MTQTTDAIETITIKEFRESEGTTEWPVVAEGSPEEDLVDPRGKGPGI